jgi:hypothetical protein
MPDLIQPVSAPEPPGWLKAIWPTLPADFRVKFLQPKTGETIFESNIGPQTWGLLCPYEEVLLGGRRGGGKSKLLIAAFAMGDLSLSEDDPARYSFLSDPSFRGLLLREEYQSMAEFVEEAVAFFKPFGGEPTGKPVQIDFKKVGSRIYFNHLGDEDAFGKYKGWNLTKIGIEELTQIKTLRRYLKLLGSLRSVDRIRKGKRYPALRTQIISTTNPDGPGAPWVKERFVEVHDKNGRLIPWNSPMLDPRTGGKRIFIPFGIEDNPFLAEDTPAGRRYRTNLLSQDEVTRKQWMEGDWNAGSSKFFSEYRPDGPIGKEENEKYPWARHIIKPVPLLPWYTRWGSGDIGFEHPSAFHKLCYNERDKRVHVYDEKQLRHVGYFEIGAILAQWWHPELIAKKANGRDPVLTIYLGADAFSKTDVTKTRAEQMEAGIKEVFGPYGALLLKYDETEREVMRSDPKRAKMLFDLRKKSLAGHMCIALQPVYVDRVAAWGYVRDWLRFRPAVMQLQTEAERDEYLKGVLAIEGREAYEFQAAHLQNLKPEILPKVQIWEACHELDRCLRVAQHDTRSDDDPSKPSRREDVLKFNADENGENGDDSLESFRNGAIAYKEIRETIPMADYVAGRIAEIQENHQQAFGEEITDPTRLAMISQTQTARYQKQFGQASAGFTLPRLSTRHRVQ